MSVDQLSRDVAEQLGKPEIIPVHFPMLVTHGISDTGLNVHSHFLTVFVSLGQKLGFSAIAECPICWPERVSGFGDVRADSVWFHKKSLNPEVAVEFERFEHGDEAKLRYKVQNLAIASLMTPSLRLALLVYWAKAGSIPRGMRDVIQSYRAGFRRGGCSVPKAKTQLMVFKCVMQAVPGTGRLLFREFLRDTESERMATGE